MTSGPFFQLLPADVCMLSTGKQQSLHALSRAEASGIHGGWNSHEYLVLIYVDGATTYAAGPWRARGALSAAGPLAGGTRLFRFGANTHVSRDDKHD